MTMAGTTKLDRTTALELRDRKSEWSARDGGGGLLSKICLPCIYIRRQYKNMSRVDRLLTWLTVLLLIANLVLVSNSPETGNGGGSTDDPVKPFPELRENLRKVKDKWDRMFIPSTPAPTMAPTEARISESLEEIAAKVSAYDWGVPPFENLVDCTADVIKKVRESGMDGSNCNGKPYAQSCTISTLTKGADSTWVEGFVDEVVTMRKDGNKGGGAQNATFVAVLLNYDCAHLAHKIRAPKDVPDLLLKWPWLWCSEPYDSPETTKWGKVGATIHGRDMDEKMVSRDLREAIKDVVIAVGGDESAYMFTGGGGVNTLARTRYVEFDFDWKGAWEGVSLRDVAKKMEAAGHMCYWAGASKLWRLTGECWQEFYSFKTWSHLACAHRVLAPKLAERMEGVFKKTIGI